jgi:hypothetical protein
MKRILGTTRKERVVSSVVCRQSAGGIGCKRSRHLTPSPLALSRWEREEEGSLSSQERARVR